MKNTKKKAFTLIELLIVIAIIGILFIVLVSKVDFATDKAKTSGVQTDFRSFQMGFETVARENAGFDCLILETDEGTADYSLLEETLNKNLDPKMQVSIDEEGTITMKNGTLDPWKNEYHGYFIMGFGHSNMGTLVIQSDGADLTPNTDDDIYMTVAYGIDNNGAEVRTESGNPYTMFN